MKIKKRTLKAAIALCLLLIASIGLWFFLKGESTTTYRYDGGRFGYSIEEGKQIYDIQLKEHNLTYDIFNVSFKSRNLMDYETRIYCLLFMPKGKENVPGLVLLPGGGVTKEGQARLAAIIAEKGYAVLTFDQRGVGETKGFYLSFEQDYEIASRGEEPVQHLSVFDALKAFGILSDIENVDKRNIAIAGESMGGRYAIIAAALDKRIKGAIGISTSGFHAKRDGTGFMDFIVSCDPDTYVQDISPRQLYMIHSLNDTKIKAYDALYTFSIAKEPKKFYSVECGSHGYCDSMKDYLDQSLKGIFGK